MTPRRPRSVLVPRAAAVLGAVLAASLAVPAYAAAPAPDAGFGTGGSVVDTGQVQYYDALATADDPPDFLEGTIYSRQSGVIQCGYFDDAPVDRSRINRIGRANATDGAWSQVDCLMACNNALPVYCVQQ